MYQWDLSVQPIVSLLHAFVFSTLQLVVRLYKVAQAHGPVDSLELPQTIKSRITYIVSWRTHH